MRLPLLATKLHIPPLRTELVSRPHLVWCINESIAGKLTLIAAPAGFGKTTLLTEWIAQYRLPVAWLSLDKSDNDPFRFWSFFIAALQTVTPDIGLAALDMLQSTHTPDLETILISLLNELQQQPGELVLVLDDYHLIDAPPIQDSLIYLIDHMPGQLHLVISSRGVPPWPLARWRVRHELNELRPVDLRFTYAESAQFLNQALGIQLAQQEIDVLQSRTEGWIAGLHMAVLSMQARLKAQGLSGISHFIESFSGANRFVLDYLVEEVINQQRPDYRDFLYETSLVDQFCPSLCNAITLREDSDHFLTQLEQSNLFLVPLDDEGEWFRYHHLFADLLRKQLKATQPGRLAEIHQRASQWYAGQNLLSEAIHHALEAKDFVRVNELVTGNALAIIEHANLRQVLSLFEELPQREFDAKPWLCVAYAWVKAYADPTTGLDPILQQAEQCLKGIAEATTRKRLAGQLAAIKAYVAWLKGEANQALEFAQAALESLPEDDLRIRCHVWQTQGLALQFLDELPEAIQSFETALSAARQAGWVQETFFASTSLAFVNILQGHLRKSFAISQQVLSLASAAGSPGLDNPILAHTYANLSMVQREWNDLASAIQNAWQGVALAEKWKQADAIHVTLTSLSKALSAAGQDEEALTVNARARQLADNVSAWFFQISICDEILLHLARRDLPAATEAFARVEHLVDEKTRDTYLFTKAFLLNAQGRYSDLLVLLEEALEGILRRGEVWFWMKLLPLRAVALQAQGRTREALGVLDQCLARAEPDGYVRIFVELGTPMRNLLRLAASRENQTAYIYQILAAYELPEAPELSLAPAPSQPTSISLSDSLLEPLSPRELQVLHLLNSPLTNEEIGRELFVSVNTIRTHIRNIYAKLGVNRRMDAVRRAKTLNL